MSLLVCCLHLWTALRRAKLSDGAIKQIDLVVEIDNCRLASAIPSVTESIFLLLTASHSSLSSPSGNLTAFLKLPLPRVASAYCLSCQLLVPRPDFWGLNGPRVRGFLKKKKKKSQHMVIERLSLHFANASRLRQTYNAAYPSHLRPEPQRVLIQEYVAKHCQRIPSPRS